MNLINILALRCHHWLSKASPISDADGAVVFGRKEPRLTQLLTDLATANRVRWSILTGGVGKDSGGLAVSEAQYLYGLLNHLHFPTDVQVFLEEQATNGVENALFSMRMAKQKNLPTGTVMAIAHGPSARRLARTLEHFGHQVLGVRPKVLIVPTSFPFDPADPKHRMEVWYEMCWMIGFPVFVRNPRVLKMYMNCYGRWLRRSQV